jgi:hypothetical protein
MKFKAVFIALLMMLAAQMAKGMDREEYEVKTLEDRARVSDFRYDSYEQSYSEAEERANNELLTVRQKARLLKTVPPGGVLIVSTLGTDWTIANGPNWTYVVTDESGNELFRSKGHDYQEPPPAIETQEVVTHGRHGRTIYSRREVEVAPQKTAFGVPVYVAKDRIDIPVKVPAVFKVFIADGINKRRCVYLLTRKSDEFH